MLDNKNDEINKIVKKLGLTPLWDEDFIKEDYCSSDEINLGERGTRPLFNWAYYLIPKGCIFPLHKLKSDESWQFCLGGPIDLFLIDNGEIKTIRVGPNIFENEIPLFIVEKNTWFAATPAPNSEYTLITHCVSPGWVPEDDIPGFYEDMIKLAPNHFEFIKKFSWPIDRKIYVQHEIYKQWN